MFPANSKYQDISEAQRATRPSLSQESREPVSVSSWRASEDSPEEYTDDQMKLLWSKVTLPPYVHQESKDYPIDFKTMF